MKRLVFILFPLIAIYSKGQDVPVIDTLDNDPGFSEWEYVGYEQYQWRNANTYTTGGFDAGCSDYTHPNAVCGRLYNRAFLPLAQGSSYSVNDPFRSEVFGWRNSHGTPQINRNGIIPPGLNFSPDFYYASMLGYFSGYDNYFQPKYSSEGIIGNIIGKNGPNLLQGETYYLTFYRRITSNGGNKLTFEIRLLNCADANGFPGGSTYTTPRIPTHSQQLYCEVQTIALPAGSSQFERVVVQFVPNANDYGVIWIYPSFDPVWGGNSGGAWLDILDMSIENYSFNLFNESNYTSNFCGPNNTTLRGYNATTGNLEYMIASDYINGATCTINCASNCTPNSFSGLPGSYYKQPNLFNVCYSNSGLAPSTYHYAEIEFNGAVHPPAACYPTLTTIQFPQAYWRGNAPQLPVVQLSEVRFSKGILFSVIESKSNQKISLSIMSQLGQVVQSIRDITITGGKNDVSVPLQQNLAAGIYFARFTIDGKVTMKKFFVPGR